MYAYTQEDEKSMQAEVDHRQDTLRKAKLMSLKDNWDNDPLLKAKYGDFEQYVRNNLR